MQSFGERLRHERETRNTTIEEISAATGIHRGFLEALEKNEFQALPGRAFGKFYLRAYAEILDFDPEPLIVHYDRERHRDLPEPAERPPDGPTLRRVEASLAKWRASHGGRKVVGRVAEVEVAEEQPPLESEVPDAAVAPTETEHPKPAVYAEPVQAEVAPNPPPVNVLPDLPPRRPHKLAATVGGVGLAVALYFAFRPAPAPPAAVVAPAPAVSQPLPTAPPAPVPALPKPAPPPRTKRVEPPPAPSTYTVSAFGVGLRDRAERVETPAAPFREGDVVAFSTRLRGGKPGQSIRHVWLHEGRAVQSIRLPIGAADWRTFSTKTLWGAGSWSVEARDESGRVLARSAFACERKPRS